MFSIEATLKDLLNFIRRFAITFRDSTFLPSRFATRMSYDAGIEYISPFIYLLLSVFINFAFTTPYYTLYSPYDEPGEFSTYVIEDLSSTSLLNKFLLALPIIQIVHISIWLIIYMLRLDTEQKQLYKKLSLYWIASILLFYNSVLLTDVLISYYFFTVAAGPQSPFNFSNLGQALTKAYAFINHIIVAAAYLTPLYIFFKKYRSGKIFFKFASICFLTGGAVYFMDRITWVELNILKAFEPTTPVLIRNEKYENNGVFSITLKRPDTTSNVKAYLDMGLFLENNSKDDIIIIYGRPPVLQFNNPPLFKDEHALGYSNIAIYLSLEHDPSVAHVILHPHEIRYFKAHTPVIDAFTDLKHLVPTRDSAFLHGDYFINGNLHRWSTKVKVKSWLISSSKADAIILGTKYDQFRYKSFSYFNLYDFDVSHAWSSTDSLLVNARSTLKSLLPYFKKTVPDRKISIYVFKDSSETAGIDSIISAGNSSFLHATDSILYLPYTHYTSFLRKQLTYCLARQFWGTSTSPYLDESIAIYTDTSLFRKNLHRIASMIVKNMSDTPIKGHFVEGDGEKGCFLDELSQKDLHTVMYSYFVFIIEKYGMGTFASLWKNGRDQVLIKQLTHSSFCRQWRNFLSQQLPLTPTTFNRLQSIPNPFGYNGVHYAGGGIPLF